MAWLSCGMTSGGHNTGDATSGGFAGVEPPSRILRFETFDAIQIREPTVDDLDAWVDLRALLWPDDPDARMEAARFFEDGTIGGLPHGVFVVEAIGGAADGLIGFAECSLRGASGSSDANRAHLEGWFVRPEWRRRGVGRRLIAAVIERAGLHGCAELTSDTTPEYPLSVAAHRACGFQVEDGDVSAGEPGDALIHFSRRIGREAGADRLA